MSEKPSPLLPDDEPSRDSLRAALALACALAVVLAGVVVPAVSGAGLGRTPLGSVVPQPSVNPYGGSGGGGSAGGGLGALDPGSRTSVGGSLASDAGAFRSRNAETHFTVRSTAAGYWRTGAYDTYTGSGWKRSGERRPYTGPIEGGGIQGREVRYRVTLRQSATALPTVWRPASVSGTATDSLAVTDRRALVAESSVPAGTTYSGVSHRPPRDPALLRTAGTDYPADVEREYTQLPASTDPRLSEFTDDLTADADNPYETARRIESWLESNKTYSLNVSQPAGEDVASQFVFEMEKGYCEYFATAMTAMLRTQGVPARYAVGYSTGQSVGANTYRVRAMNAHAWVEVYFPEVGWVRFDPTPGSARLRAEQRAFANRTGADAGRYSPVESGSPGERFSPNGSAENATTGSGNAPGTATGSGAGTATGGEPAGTTGESGTGTSSGSGAGTADGTGDGRGTASGSGSGTATRESGGTTGSEGGTTGGSDGTTGADGSTPDGTTTTGSGEDGETGRETTTREDSAETPSNSPYDVALNRTPVPGATVAVTVTDDGSAASGVPVYFNGERVGVTDESGTVTGQVPYAERLRITLGRSGGDAASLAGPGSDARLPTGPPADFDAPLALTGGPPPTLAAADVAPARSTDGAAPGNETNGTEYPLATNATLTVSGEVATGSEVVVTATVQDVPVRNARVTLGNETVGTTDRRGRVRVALPESPGDVTLAVERGPVAGERTLTIPRLGVSVDPALPVALPWTPVEVRATYGGDPLANASVRVAGTDRTTDINGTATAPLPFRGSAEVVVAAKGQTRRTAVSGLYANLAGVLGGAALLLGGLAYAARRRGLSVRALAAALLGALRAVPSVAVALLFGATDRLAQAIETVLAALAELRAGETTVRELLARLRAWLAERFRAVRRSATGGWSTGALGEDLSGDAGSPADPEADSYRTLREAWETFLRAVSVRRPAAATPGELADHAVRVDGLPAGPVAALRDAFRDVEYGARSPDDRLPQVEEAISAIERAMRPDGDETETADDAPTPGGDD
ncbi:transglutaminaseTgpA domain-containing protein [Halorussus sp. AFM4]|uniref:transglutaminase family protein n=1 Tax=Halorussus sp. AFM4 TaxID=3421651 RepID=UPI003EBF9751